MTTASSTLDDGVRRTFERTRVRRHTGLAVAAFDADDEVVHTAGEVERGGGMPRADTLFQIGSVTKVLTSLLLADAVGRGEVRLDTPLRDLLPEAPPATHLVDLATHTAGLPRLPPGLLRSADRSNPYRDVTGDSLREALAAADTKTRGTVRYSNFGAALLAEALATATGLAFADLVEQRVCGPLGMSDTVCEPRPDQWDRQATGHSRFGRPRADWHLGAMAGAGALWSTAQDMRTFLRAQAQPTRTPLADALTMTQQPRVRAGARFEVCLGWMRSPVRGTDQHVLWHNGATGGFASFVAVLPGRDVGVAVLGCSTRPVDRIGQRLVRALAAPPA